MVINDVFESSQAMLEATPDASNGAHCYNCSLLDSKGARTMNLLPPVFCSHLSHYGYKFLMTLWHVLLPLDYEPSRTRAMSYSLCICA